MIKMLNKKVGGLALSLVGGLLACSPVHAEWPTDTVKIVVASSPGGAPDRFARLYAEQLTSKLGKPVIVENRPGAAGNVAAGIVARADDQHTIFWGFSSIFGINPHVYKNSDVDARASLVPVAPILKQGLVLVANNEFPAKTLKDLVKYAEERPGDVDYASYGVAGYPHLIMETLEDVANIDMVHVPYAKQAMVDVIGGQIGMVAEPISTAMGQIKAKTVTPIAYSGDQRHPDIPDVETFNEVFPEMSAVFGIHGVWMPKGTPEHVIQRLNAAFNEVTAMPEVATRVKEVSCEPFQGSPDDLGEVVDQEYTRWGDVIERRGIKIE